VTAGCSKRLARVRLTSSVDEESRGDAACRAAHRCGSRGESRPPGRRRHARRRPGSLLECRRGRVVAAAQLDVGGPHGDRGRPAPSPLWAEPRPRAPPSQPRAGARQSGPKPAAAGAGLRGGRGGADRRVGRCPHRPGDCAGDGEYRLRARVRAEAAAAMLQARVRSRARVLRDGDPSDVPTEDVVPGDVVLLSASC
jgi:hypothetical protein